MSECKEGLLPVRINGLIGSGPTLPAELVVQVLQHLPVLQRWRAQFVCRDWRKLVHSDICWRNMRHLTLGRGWLSRAIALRLRRILPRIGRHVRQLTFAASVHSEHLTLLARFCPHVEHIDLQVGVLNEHLHTIGIKFGPQLHSLCFRRIFNDQDVVLEKLFSRAKRLKQLRLTSNCEINGTCLRGLKATVAVEELVISRGDHLRPDMINFALSELAMHLQVLELPGCELRMHECFEEMSELRRLVLRRCVCPLPLFCAVEHMHQLLELDLSCARELDVTCCEAIGDCRSLRVLNLSGANDIDDECLKAIAACQSLQYLNVSSLDNVGPACILDVALQLEFLRVLALENAKYSPKFVLQLLRRAIQVEMVAVSSFDADVLQKLVLFLSDTGAKSHLKRLFVVELAADVSEEDVEELRQTENHVALVEDSFCWEKLVPDWREFAAQPLPLDPLRLTVTDESCRLRRQHLHAMSFGAMNSEIDLDSDLTTQRSDSSVLLDEDSMGIEPEELEQ